MLTVFISTALRLKGKIKHQETLVTGAEGLQYMLLAIFLNVHVRCRERQRQGKEIAWVPFKFS